MLRRPKRSKIEVVARKEEERKGLKYGAQCLDSEVQHLAYNLHQRENECLHMAKTGLQKA
jgi:hypothetical protein